MNLDYKVLKTFDRKDLMELVPKGFKFKRKPWQHQIAAFIANIANDGFNDWLDLGTGKTQVGIDSCRYWKSLKDGEYRVLVVCLNTAVENWRDEIHINSNMPATCLRGPIKDRWDMIKGEGFFIVNFEGLTRMMTKKEKVYKDRKWKGKLVLDQRMITRIKNIGFDCFIIDESHKIGNPRSLIYKSCNAIALKTPHRMNLTGTPFGKSMKALWTQYYIADRGETFGNNYYKFRDKTCEDVGVFMGKDFKIASKWEIHDEGKAWIESKMWNKAIRYNEGEIKELPPKVKRIWRFKLSKEQQKDYDDALEKIGSWKDLKNKTMVLRQICSGIIVNGSFIYKKNPKLDLLSDLIDSVVDREKIVIFHEFLLEYEIISKLLNKKKIKYNYLNSRAKDNYKQYKTFEKDDDYRVMIAHPLSGGSSINMNVAQYCVFFSNTYNPLDRRQCEKRIHRGRIKRRRFYYDLISDAGVEWGIYKSLKNNSDFFSSIIDQKGDWRESLKRR